MAKLYIVGTPIGNLEDFSPRAQRILSSVSFIAAEDTRVTLKLLNHFEIKTEIISYHEHNKREKGEYIINRILSGEDCALVTDAGMPAISDPGEDLVREARERAVEIESVPAATAFATALAASGMSSRRFCFEGFLPMEKKERRKLLEELISERRTMIFYEAPHKLIATLEDLYKAFGEREIAVAKELTKLHETVLRFSLSSALEYYNENPPKGEFVLIIEGAAECEKVYSLEDAVSLCRSLIDGGMSPSAAAKEAAAVTKIKKGEIYSAVLK